MATTRGDKVSWSDIQAIYSTLNDCQTKFGVSRTAAPANPGVCRPNVVQDLKTFIFALRNSTYVDSSFVSPVFNITVPAVGSLITPQPFDTMESTLNTVFNLCARLTNFGNDGDFGRFGDFGDNGSKQGYTCFASNCSNDFCNARF